MMSVEQSCLIVRPSIVSFLVLRMMLKVKSTLIESMDVRVATAGDVVETTSAGYRLR